MGSHNFAQGGAVSERQAEKDVTAVERMERMFHIASSADLKNKFGSVRLNWIESGPWGT